MLNLISEETHISNLSESLSAWAILDCLNGHGYFYRLSFWSPKALKNKLNVELHTNLWIISESLTNPGQLVPCAQCQKHPRQGLWLFSALRASEGGHEPWCLSLQDPAAQSSATNRPVIPRGFSSSQQMQLNQSRRYSWVFCKVSPLRSPGTSS